MIATHFILRQVLCVVGICIGDARPFRRYSDPAPAETEVMLRNAKGVLFFITTDFVRSKYCLDALRWAWDEQDNWRAVERQRYSGCFSWDGYSELVPVYYNNQNSTADTGNDSFQDNSLHALLWQQHYTNSEGYRVWQSQLDELLRQHHPAASDIDREQWNEDLVSLSYSYSEERGVRQDAGRCGGDA